MYYHFMAIAERPVRVPSPDDERSPFYLPLPIDTRFTKHLAWAAESMTIADAVDDTLEHTGITVEVDATTSNANGAIFVADHSQHIEPLLSQIVARAYGHDKSHVIAMPCSFTGRILQTALPNHDVVIPVIPTFFSREHEPLKISQPASFAEKRDEESIPTYSIDLLKSSVSKIKILC